MGCSDAAEEGRGLVPFACPNPKGCPLNEARGVQGLDERQALKALLGDLARRESLTASTIHGPFSSPLSMAAYLPWLFLFSSFSASISDSQLIWLSYQS
mmetsp:Transcript_35956/g.84168  ORF Transcript_35956/g.84168 Transcript_35956/m.84168 type:complete len:99 (-) Transcript_35956:522-818(-)